MDEEDEAEELDELTGEDELDESEETSEEKEVEEGLLTLEESFDSSELEEEEAKELVEGED